MSKLKKLLSAAVGGILAVNLISMLPVGAEENACSEGVILNSTLGINNIFENPGDIPTTTASVPSSVDLSTSPCFPPIGDQGRLSSCVAFATTYYQYSYEVNKLNNVTNVSDRVIYSPKWTYNLINNGKNLGLNPIDAYSTLETLGSLKNSDFPYTDNFKEWPSQLQNEKIEALETRVENTSKYDIPLDNTIQNVNDPYLNIVKQMLNNGKVLTVVSHNRWNSVVQNGESLAFRCYQGGSHMLTVVGYDDNKSYDVNGNGIIEDCEKGAFKIANSWGTSFVSSGISSNTGYFWVMYDALNKVSANNVNNWEAKYSGTRSPAFNKLPDCENAFFTIDVAHKNVNFVGRLSVNTSDRETLTLKINRGTSTLWSHNNAYTIFPYVSSDSGGYAYNGDIFFDYDNLASPISRYCNGYNWFTYLSGTTIGDDYEFNVLDNLGNEIGTDKQLIKFDEDKCAYAYQNISLKKGDVNYDGAITTADVDYIVQYILQVNDLSNVQYYLADYNNDGSANSADVIAMRRDNNLY